MGKIYLILIILLLIPILSAETSNETICQNIFFFIMENNYNYTDNDLIVLRDELNITSDFLKEYMDNYFEFCYLKGYSEKLPKKPTPTLIVIKPNQNKVCEVNTGNLLYDYLRTPKLFEFSIGKDVSCGKIWLWRIFFMVEVDVVNNYSIVGIKLLPPLLIVFLIWFTSFLRGNSRLNNLIKNFK